MSKYKTIAVPIPIRGINKDIEPTKLGPGFSPNLKNMVVEETKLRKRLGGSYLGSNLPLEGIGMEVISYEDMRGGVHHIAITSENVYEYNSDNEEWLCINPGVVLHNCESGWNAGTGCAVSYDSTYKKQGTNSLKVSITSSRSDGDKLAYSDDFGSVIDLTSAAAVRTEHLNSVGFWLRSDTALAVGALEIVLTEASAGAKTGDYVEVTNDEVISADTWYFIKVAASLANMDSTLSIGVFANTALDGSTTPINVYIDAVWAYFTFTGGVDDLWTHTVATDVTTFSNNGGSALIICNGIDKLYCYEGAADEHFREFDASDIPSFTSVKEIIEFWNHFMLFNYNDGAQNTKAVKFADFADVVDYSGGTSGTAILTDSKGSILRAEKLGPELVIYSSSSLTMGRYVGIPNIYLFPTLVYETGLFSKKSMWASVNVHYFIGTDLKFHGYTGGQNLLHIGNQIEDTFFKDMDVSKKDKLVVGVDAGRHKVYFNYPGPGDSYAKKFYALNYKQNPQTWEAGEFYHSVRGFALFDNKVGWRCNGIQVAGKTCAESAFRCDSSYTQSGYPQTIIISADGYIIMLDEAFGSDCGQPIECITETEDWTADGELHKFRCKKVHCNVKSSIAGGTANVYYSLDSGATWVEMDDSPIALNTVWTEHLLPVDFLGRKVRYKFRQYSKEDFQIRGLAHDVALREDR